MTPTSDTANRPSSNPGTEPTLPEVSVNLVRPTEPVVGRVIASEHCTLGGRKASGFVRHVAIDVSGTPLAGSFRAGQSFGVLPPGEDERGKPHKLRLYSISAPTRGEDGEGNVLSTTVKRVVDEHWDSQRLFTGVCSNYLCDLRPGDEVRVTGPSGKRFVLPEDPAAHDYLFFATGTGIAPFRGMLGDLVAAGVESRVTLVMGVPYRSDLLYHNDLVALAESHPNIRYVTALSRQPQDDTARMLYVQDRIACDPAVGSDASILSMLASPRTLVYACGLSGMELGIFREIHRALGPEAASAYLSADDEVAGDPSSWDRRMIGRQIKITRRVFLEVY